MISENESHISLTIDASLLKYLPIGININFLGNYINSSSRTGEHLVMDVFEDKVLLWDIKNNEIWSLFFSSDKYSIRIHFDDLNELLESWFEKNSLLKFLPDMPKERYTEKVKIVKDDGGNYILVRPSGYYSIFDSLSGNPAIWPKEFGRDYAWGNGHIITDSIDTIFRSLVVPSKDEIKRFNSLVHGDATK